MERTYSGLINKYFSGLGGVFGKLLDSSPPKINPCIGVIVSIVGTSIVSFSRTFFQPVLALVLALVVSLVTRKVRELLYVSVFSFFFAATVALPVFLFGDVKNSAVFVLRVTASASFFTSLLGSLGWFGVVRGLETLGLGGLTSQLGLLARYIPEFIRKAQASVLAREARTFGVSRRARWTIGLSLVGDLIYEGFRTSYWLSLSMRARYFENRFVKRKMPLYWSLAPLDFFMLLSLILLACSMIVG